MFVSQWQRFDKGTQNRLGDHRVRDWNDVAPRQGTRQPLGATEAGATLSWVPSGAQACPALPTPGRGPSDVRL